MVFVNEKNEKYCKVNFVEIYWRSFIQRGVSKIIFRAGYSFGPYCQGFPVKTILNN